MKRKAKLLINRKLALDNGAIMQAVVWELPEPLPGSMHLYKYRLFFGKPGMPMVRYDNERGKGDHRHLPGGVEVYTFIDLDTLYRDFLRDVERYE